MKKILTICAILILVVVAGIFYFAQNEVKDLKVGTAVIESQIQVKTVSDKKEEIAQNEEIQIDTSNWKTYTNEKYGFSIKYPEKLKTPYYKSDNKTIVISKDRGNFILISSELTHSFEKQFDQELEKCQKWLNEFSINKKSNKYIIRGSISGYKSILNLRSCGFNLAEPKEVLVFNKAENKLVRIKGSIYIDDISVMEPIYKSFRFQLN